MNAGNGSSGGGGGSGYPHSPYSAVNYQSAPAEFHPSVNGVELPPKVDRSSKPAHQRSVSLSLPTSSVRRPVIGRWRWKLWNVGSLEPREDPGTGTGTETETERTASVLLLIFPAEWRRSIGAGAALRVARGRRRRQRRRPLPVAAAARPAQRHRSPPPGEALRLVNRISFTSESHH